MENAVIVQNLSNTFRLAILLILILRIGFDTAERTPTSVPTKSYSYLVFGRTPVLIRWSIEY